MFEQLKKIFQPKPVKEKEELSSFQGDGVHLFLPELIALKRFVPFLSMNAQGSSKAEGMGQHRSKFKGRGMEFDDVRSYHQGDDIRLIDWRLTARTGKAYTKLYREERERPVLFLGDFRPRMHFGTRQAFKSVIVGRLLAALAWASRENGDKVGAILFSAGHYKKVAPHRQMRRLMEIFNSIVLGANDNLENESKPLSQSLAELRRVSRNGARVYVISDFYDFDSECEKHLADMAKHCEVICLQVYDVLEKNPPPAGSYRISDGQNETTIQTDKIQWQKEYDKVFTLPRKELETFCIKHKILYIGLCSDMDIMQTLRRSLFQIKRK